MMRGGMVIAWLILAGAADAGGLGAARNLVAGTVIAPGDLTVIDTDRPALTDPSEAIGMQLRVAVYAGRPILESQLTAPRLVTRNQIVRIAFQRGALRINTEGRAMADGTEGAVIPVMNLISRVTMHARVNPDGTLSVSD